MSGAGFRVIASAAVLVTSCGAAWAQSVSQPDPYVYGPPMMWWRGGWYGMGFGSLFMVLVLVAVIAITVALVRWTGGPWRTSPDRGPRGLTPLDILKERFARGEIDKAEFEERRQVLND